MKLYTLFLAIHITLTRGSYQQDLLSSKGKNYCSYHPKQNTEPCCKFETIDSINKKILPELTNLSKTKFFSHYKVNLYKVCQFWNADGKCMRRDCSVDVLSDLSQIPEEWECGKSIGDVDFSNNNFGSSQNVIGSPFIKCDYTTKDFCIIDDESSLSDGVYVNLLKNPERYTGYDGEAAHKVWSSIYNENCFNSHFSTASMPNLFDRNEDTTQCIEARVYYKLISGLHASISTHICAENFNKTSGEWFADVDCFVNRVGLYPERVENMYFLYAVITRALTKLIPYLKTYNFCTINNGKSDETNKLVEKIILQAESCPTTFNETLLFNSMNSQELKNEFKEHFRNVSRIMDCVTCEKCKLWGKIQTSGLGTALKVLFSYGEKLHGIALTRGELVALFNTFHKVSESINAKNIFDNMLHEKANKQWILAEIAAEKKLLDSVKRGLLINVDIFHPKTLWSYFLGIIIAVVGVISISRRLLFPPKEQTDDLLKAQKRNEDRVKEEKKNSKHSDNKNVKKS